MGNRRKPVEQRLIAFIREHDLLQPGEKVVVAVSGGADSVCLLHMLWRWQTELAVGLNVAHLNHRLRGTESDSDANYVSDLASKLGLPVVVESCDVAAYHAQKGGSLEEAARQVRYSFLAKVAKGIGASKVVVGHTQDDHIETVLMHLLRGTGSVGLCGLQPRAMLRFGKNGEQLEVVRPLLKVTRQETLDYCRRYKLEPRSDSSNVSTSFLRNRVRLELLPVLRDYNPGIEQALLRLAAISSDDVSFIEAQASTLWKELVIEEGSAIFFDRAKMVALPRAVQRYILRRAVKQLRGDLKDIEADHIETMMDFLLKPAGKRLCLPQGLTLFTEYGRLVLTLSKVSLCPLPPLEGVFDIKVPGETVISGWRVKADISGKPPSFDNSFIAAFDLDKVAGELTVRRRRPGDRFQPLGMAETKKLQDFMVDAKIPRSWRDRVPLVCSSDQVVWVVGWRIDDRVKVTGTTENILQLEFQRLS